MNDKLRKQTREMIMNLAGLWFAFALYEFSAVVAVFWFFRPEPNQWLWPGAIRTLDERDMVEAGKTLQSVGWARTRHSLWMRTLGAGRRLGLTGGCCLPVRDFFSIKTRYILDPPGVNSRYKFIFSWLKASMVKLLVACAYSAIIHGAM